MPEKFSPEDIQKLNESREKETNKLKRGNAFTAEKARLHITPQQYDEAHKEMRHELNSRLVKVFEGKSEIHESKTFSERNTRFDCRYRKGYS